MQPLRCSDFSLVKETNQREFSLDVYLEGILAYTNSLCLAKSRRGACNRLTKHRYHYIKLFATHFLVLLDEKDVLKYL